MYVSYRMLLALMLGNFRVNSDVILEPLMVVHVAKLVTLKSVGMIIHAVTLILLSAVHFIPRISWLLILSTTAMWPLYMEPLPWFVKYSLQQVWGQLKLHCLALCLQVRCCMIIVENCCRSFMRWTIFFASHIILQVLELIHVHG